MQSIFSFNNQQSENSQSCFPKLSWNERLIGFAICFALGSSFNYAGYLMQILSIGSFLALVTGNPTKFAVIYSLGNILAWAGTGFLLGFRKQIENMADKDRRICSSIFVGALIGTLISAFFFHSKLLVLAFLVIQIPAYIWYVASYIPFARDCLRSCVGSLFDKFRR